MPSKLKIKIGPVEVEYEGEERFLKEELPALLEAVGRFRKTSGLDLDKHIGDKDGNPPVVPKDLTTSVVASRLSAKSGTDLIQAAAFSLTNVQGKASFTRDELVTEMRTAKAFFKKTFISNLSGYLKSLATSQKLNELGNDSYSVPEGVLTETRRSLGL
jgi:hypothetical protein